MEAWSRRLMTRHAHPLPTPVSHPVKKKSLAVNIAVPDRRATIIKRFARDGESELGLVNFTVSLSHFFSRSPMEIKVRRQRGMPCTRTTSGDGKTIAIRSPGDRRGTRIQCFRIFLPCVTWNNSALPLFPKTI